MMPNKFFGKCLFILFLSVGVSPVAELPALASGSILIPPPKKPRKKKIKTPEPKEVKCKEGDTSPKCKDMKEEK